MIYIQDYDYAIITAHANDMASAKDDNRYDKMRQEMEDHRAKNPSLSYIMGIDANACPRPDAPHIGPHSMYTPSNKTNLGEIESEA